MITVPQLDPVNTIADDDVIMITHSNGTTEKVTMANALSKSEIGSITIPSQTLNNGESAEVTIPLIPNKFYCGRIDFSALPSANMTISYNDFSGLFQDAKTTENRLQCVLHPIGRALLATLHIYLTNYTGSPVTIGNIIVSYCLEHHTMI